jgi:hypothetical protein
VGEIWIIKWAVKQVKADKNDGNHEMNYLLWLCKPFPDASLLTHLIVQFFNNPPI